MFKVKCKKELKTCTQSVKTNCFNYFFQILANSFGLTRPSLLDDGLVNNTLHSLQQIQ